MMGVGCFSCLRRMAWGSCSHVIESCLCIACGDDSEELWGLRQREGLDVLFRYPHPSSGHPDWICWRHGANFLLLHASRRAGDLSPRGVHPPGPISRAHAGPQEVGLTVTANLDDTIVHKDELYIIVNEGDNRVISLAARGTGPTVW